MQLGLGRSRTVAPVQTRCCSCALAACHFHARRTSADVAHMPTYGHHNQPQLTQPQLADILAKMADPGRSCSVLCIALALVLLITLTGKGTTRTGSYSCSFVRQLGGCPMCSTFCRTFVCCWAVHSHFALRTSRNVHALLLARIGLTLSQNTNCTHTHTHTRRRGSVCQCVRIQAAGHRMLRGWGRHPGTVRVRDSVRQSGLLGRLL